MSERTLAICEVESELKAGDPAALFALALSAQAAADPPGRVGRIAWMSGTVQLRKTLQSKPPLSTPSCLPQNPPRSTQRWPLHKTI